MPRHETVGEKCCYLLGNISSDFSTIRRLLLQFPAMRDHEAEGNREPEERRRACTLVAGDGGDLTKSSDLRRKTCLVSATRLGVPFNVMNHYVLILSMDD